VRLSDNCCEQGLSPAISECDKLILGAGRGSVLAAFDKLRK